MKQTMLGLLALMTAMLLSVNTQRSSVAVTVRMIDNEMEMIAGGVALEVLDYVGSLPFDAATINGEVESTSELTPPPFSTGKSYAAANDIDDFHEMATETLQAFEFDFTVDVSVSYVDEDDPEQEVGYRTFAKKVTVIVDNDHMRSPVQLANVYSYP